MLLKEKLKRGECVLGTWCDIPSPAVSNVIAKAGLDFMIIDMEHGPMDFKVTQEMAMAAEAGGSEAIVRVPTNDESAILRSLDLGSAGIMVPRVGSAASRAQVVNFAKYPPVGKRGFNPYIRGLGYSAVSTEESNRDTILALMLEDVESINN
jgi:2-keto-3-deoxy-L-rhamnonate aldolase RhmA